MECKDHALIPANLHYEPQKSDPDSRFLNDNRLFQGIPTVEVTPDGTIYTAFYGGMDGEMAGNFIVLLKSDIETLSFGEPYLIIEPPTPDCRTFDPCLWRDPQNRLWLFYAQSYHMADGRMGVWAVVCEDTDSQPIRFSEPRRIANGIMMNKPTVLSDGTWLLPCAIWIDEISDDNDLPEERFSNVYCSHDQGETFELIGHADYDDRRVDEHMIVERKDGTLWMLIRGTNGIGQSFSDDKGVTWYGTGYSGIENPCSRFHIRRLQSGRLLLINHIDFVGGPNNPTNAHGRCRLAAMLSEDDGRTWPYQLMIDPGMGVSYPDMAQDINGRMYIVYDHGRRGDAKIKLASITQSDIIAGEIITPASFLMRVINRGKEWIPE